MLKIAEIIISSRKSGESTDSLYQIVINTRPTIIASGVPDPDRLNRLTAFLDNLMTKTKEKHDVSVQENNKLKDNSELITRVTLDEFSLYTKDTPLSIYEYKHLIHLIAERAKTLPPNLHFQIGTVPVLWPNGVMQNCGLYVQSPSKPGQEPLIHHLSKVHASAVDIQYGYQTVTGAVQTYPLAGDNPYLDSFAAPGGIYSPEILLKDTCINMYDVNQHKNAFRITSASGQQFLQVVDICLDHIYGVAKSYLHGLIDQLAKKKQFIPINASHIISSKIVNSNENNLIATVTHADLANDKVGTLAPADGKKKQPIYFGVGGFGQSAQYTIYPPKNIGILSGNDLEHAIWRNASNGLSFDVNAVYEGTTLLHMVITKSNSSLEKILNRIKTLKKYHPSIDIANAQKQTVRAIVSGSLINALLVNNIQDIEKFVCIASALAIYTPLKEQIHQLYFEHRISPEALIFFKHIMPQLLPPAPTPPILTPTPPVVAHHPKTEAPVVPAGHAVKPAINKSIKINVTPTPVTTTNIPQPAVAINSVPKRKISNAETLFEEQLNLLVFRKKELEDRMPDASERNRIRLEKAVKAINILHKGLIREKTTYFQDPTPESYVTFKQNCDGLITTAHKSLDKHRGWSEFLINLTIGIVTVGVGLIIKGAVNYAMNKSLFFAHQTESSKTVDNVSEHINKMKPK